MQGAWRFQERRLRKSAAIVLATAIAPVAAAEAQGIAIERIEAIERQIGGLQSELRRLKSELGEAKQQTGHARSFRRTTLSNAVHTEGAGLPRAPPAVPNALGARGGGRHGRAPRGIRGNGCQVRRLAAHVEREPRADGPATHEGAR